MEASRVATPFEAYGNVQGDSRANTSDQVSSGACCKKCYEIFRSQFRSILGKNATKLDNLINEFLKIRSILGYEIS